jgi:hypothetical protein
MKCDGVCLWSRLLVQWASPVASHSYAFEVVAAEKKLMCKSAFIGAIDFVYCGNTNIEVTLDLTSKT